MASIYYDKDASLDPVRSRKVAVIGYGSQGHAHALNLKESGVDVRVGLPEGSKSRARAQAAGLKVLSVADAAREADLVMILAPDEKQKRIYDEDIAPHLGRGKALFFAHGFNIHYGQIKPPPEVDVTLIAPKAPGHMVRRLYQGAGHAGAHRRAPGRQRPGQGARALLRARARRHPRGRAGDHLQEETETDLFGEQTVLCGGVTGARARPASRRWSRPATSRRARTSSACTS